MANRYKPVKDHPGKVWVPVKDIRPGMLLWRFGAWHKVIDTIPVTYIVKGKEYSRGRIRLLFANNTTTAIEAIGSAEYIMQESSVPMGAE